MQAPLLPPRTARAAPATFRTIQYLTVTAAITATVFTILGAMESETRSYGAGYTQGYATGKQIYNTSSIPDTAVSAHIDYPDAYTLIMVGACGQGIGSVLIALIISCCRCCVDDAIDGATSVTRSDHTLSSATRTNSMLSLIPCLVPLFLQPCILFLATLDWSLGHFQNLGYLTGRLNGIWDACAASCTAACLNYFRFFSSPYAITAQQIVAGDYYLLDTESFHDDKPYGSIPYGMIAATFALLSGISFELTRYCQRKKRAAEELITATGGAVTPLLLTEEPIATTGGAATPLLAATGGGGAATKPKREMTGDPTSYTP